VKGIQAPELAVSRQNPKIQNAVTITASILKISSATLIHISSSYVSSSKTLLDVTLSSPSWPSSRRLPTSLSTKIWHLFLQRNIAAAEKKTTKINKFISIYILKFVFNIL
jgi:hypothetical protein